MNIMMISVLVLCSTKVTVTGDSLTVGYSSKVVQAYQDLDIDIELTVLATGGLKSPQYVGREINSNNGYLRDYVAETITSDPDIIQFMLGTNDSFNCTPGEFEQYKLDLIYIFDSYQSFINGRGVHPVLVVSSVIPILREGPAATQEDWVARHWVSPWLRQVTLDRQICFIDNWCAIQHQEGWKSWYRDGIHLYAEGYNWMALSFATASQVCPTTVVADANFDGDVDQEDYGVLQRCFAGPGVLLPGCRSLDDDQDVDQDDLGVFQACSSGPDVPTDITCVE